LTVFTLIYLNKYKMPNVTKISAKREEMVIESLEANNRPTDEKSMKRHKVGVKKFINDIEDFDEKKLKQYFDEYCTDDNNFEEIEVAVKPKRTLSDKQKEAMSAGRKAAKAAREAEAAEKAAESEKEDKAEEKPKNAKAKSAKA
jgi:hypothetical protein